MSPAPAKTSSRSWTEETGTMFGRGSCFFHQGVFAAGAVASAPAGTAVAAAAAAAAAPGASTAVVASVLGEEEIGEEGEGAVGAEEAEEEARALVDELKGLRLLARRARGR